MKTYSKRFLAVFLSLMIVISSTQSAFASTSTWYPQSVVVTGSTALITAAKQGFRSSISHVPSGGSVARSLAKGVAPLALLLAVTQKLGDGVDWVLDPENNAVKYTTPYVDKGADTVCNVKVGSSVTNDTMTAGAFCSSQGLPFTKISSFGQVSCGGSIYGALSCPKPAPVNNYIPLSELADKVISNAAQGHYESQKVIKDAATDDLYSGSIDGKLTANQVESDAPFDPTRPNDPASTPFDASSLIAAMQSVMSAINNMSSSLKAKLESIGLSLGSKLDTIVDGQTETNRVINDSIDRAIENDNVKTADIVAAIEAIEGNTLDGQVINDAVDRAIAEGKTNTSDIVAAIEAIEGNTLDGQVINDAVDRVIANDNVNAQAAADAAEVAEAARAADAQAAADAAEVAEAARAADAKEAKEAADAKAAADAAALEWAKEAPEAPTDTGVIVDEPISDFDSDKSYITFTGSCPPKYTASLNVMGATAPFEFDYTPICTVMSYLKPFIVGAGYIAAAYIIAGHSRGSKD